MTFESHSKLSESQAVKLLIPILFLAGEATPGETHFFLLLFIEKSFLGKNMCLYVTNGRSYAI